MMAAHDTLASSLTTFVWLLAVHPEWQARLREETLGLGLAPSEPTPFDALDRLKLTEMAFKETLRLVPPLAAIPRRAIRDVHFKGFRIPAGRPVGAVPIHTHSCRRCGRIRTGSTRCGSRTRRNALGIKYAFVPFGGGAHMCLGLNYAHMQSRAFARHLLQRFEFRLPPGYEPSWSLLPIAKPKGGLPVEFKPDLNESRSTAGTRAAREIVTGFRRRTRRTFDCRAVEAAGQGSAMRGGHAPFSPPPVDDVPRTAAEHDGLPNPQRLLAFLTLAMAVGMSVLDGSIVNVALPTIARDLAIQPRGSIWIVNAFLLAVTDIAAAAVGARRHDRLPARLYARPRALHGGLARLRALRRRCRVLTAARAVQGLGAAGIMSVNIALVRFIYPSSKLGQGVGNVAVVVAVCSAGSPTVAAAILAVASWRWLFLINVPFGARRALVVAVRTLPDTPRSKRMLDPFSVALNALTFGLLIAGVDGLGQNREDEASRSANSSPAAAFGALFVAQATRAGRAAAAGRPSEAADLRACRSRPRSASFAAQSLAIVALPFYFEDTLGRSETATGLLMTPWPLATALIAPISGRLADRFAPALLGGAGLSGDGPRPRARRPRRRRSGPRSRSSGGLRSAGSASASSSRRTTG